MATSIAMPAGRRCTAAIKLPVQAAIATSGDPNDIRKSTTDRWHLCREQLDWAPSGLIGRAPSVFVFSRHGFRKNKPALFRTASTSQFRWCVDSQLAKYDVLSPGSSIVLHCFSIIGNVPSHHPLFRSLNQRRAYWNRTTRDKEAQRRRNKLDERWWELWFNEIF